MELTETPLTPRQAELLQFITAFHAEHGYAPTFDEMEIGMGCSRNAITSFLKILARKGFIERKERQRVRGMELTGVETPGTHIQTNCTGDDLTPRQRELLLFIQVFMARERLVPTVREMCVGVGLGLQTNAICGHLKALRKKGYVEWVKGRSGTIRILKSI